MRAALLAFSMEDLLLGLAKLWLTSAQPQFVISGAGHDDLLFINLAKGLLYPCWIALLHLLGIPLRLGTELANLIAGCLAGLALRPLMRPHTGPASACLWCCSPTRGAMRWAPWVE
jgi:hypothetical protein